MWWRPDFETLLYPYLPPNIKRPKVVTYLIHQIAHGHPEVYIWSCLFAELKDEGAWTTLPAFRTVSSSHGILKYLISHIYIEVRGVEVERRGRGESCRVTLTAKT